MFRSIWSKSLREFRVPIICWGGGLGILILIGFATATQPVLDAYATLVRSYLFLADPVAIHTPEGYITTRYLETILPILLSIWPILVGARLVRGEEERGSLDLLLATPRSRLRVMLEKLLALVGALLLIALLIALLTVTGQYQLEARADIGRAFLTALNVVLLPFFFAMLALLIAQFTSSRGSAAGLASGLMLLGFVLDGTGRVTGESWLQYLSPFYYYNLNRPLVPTYNNTPVAAVALCGLGLLLAVFSIVIFARRDSGRPALSLRSGTVNEQRLIEQSLRRAGRDLSLRSVFSRALSAQGWASFWWLLGIAAWCGWLTALVPTIQKPFKDALAQSPDLAKLFGGGDVGTNAGFLGVLVFGFVIAIVVTFALTLALTWSGDLENGRLELLLSVPRSRTRMLLERAGAILLMALLAVVLSWLAVVIGAQKVNLSIDASRVMFASISMLPPALIVVALTFALARRLRHGAVIGLLAGYIALAFMADLLRGLFNLPDWLLKLSIFHLYGTPAISGMDWGAFLGMLGVAILLLLLGILQFRSGDIERG